MNLRPDSQVASPIRIEGIIYRLEDWRDQVRQRHIKTRLHLKTPEPADERLVKDLRHLHLKVNLDDIDEIEATIGALKTWLKTAPVLNFTFSTPPSPQIQEKVVDWLHKEISPEVLVNFQVDGQVAAGFLLRTKNRLFDFSANEILWRNRKMIAELAKHV